MDKIKEQVLSGWKEGLALYNALAKSYSKGRKVVANPQMAKIPTAFGWSVSWIDYRVNKKGERIGQDRYKTFYVRQEDYNSAFEVINSFVYKAVVN